MKKIVVLFVFFIGIHENSISQDQQIALHNYRGCEYIQYANVNVKNDSYEISKVFHKYGNESNTNCKTILSSLMFFYIQGKNEFVVHYLENCIDGEDLDNVTPDMISRIITLYSFSFNQNKISELIKSIEKYKDWERKAQKFDFEFSKVILKTQNGLIVLKPEFQLTESSLQYIFHSRIFNSLGRESFFMFYAPQSKELFKDIDTPEFHYLLTKENIDRLLPFLVKILNEMKLTGVKIKKEKEIIEREFR